MKKLHAFLFVLLLIGVLVKHPAHAQPYKSMLIGSSEWTVVNCDQFNNCLIDRYIAAEDTTIYSTTYKLLDYFHYNRNFAIREELNSGKVYLRYWDGLFWSQEFLLYDFSLNVGEQVNVQNPISPAPPNPGMFTVDSIKYEPFLLDTRKVLYLTGPDTSLGLYNQAVWVEGMGSKSLINTPGSGPNASGSGELMCFYRNGELIYRKQVRDIDSCSSQFVGIQEQQPLEDPITITHLPKEKSVQVSFFKETNHVHTLQLINLNGKVVWNTSFFGKRNNLRYPAKLPLGIYLVRITGNDFNYSKKLVLTPF